MNNETVDTTEPTTTTENPSPDTSGEGSTPVQVVSVDELVERLTAGSDEQSESDPAGAADSDTPQEPTLAEQYFTQMMLDTTNQEILTEVRKIETQLTESVHPALTTNFEDYTVTESLLLLLFLCVFGSFIVRMVKGAFHWLAW